MVKKIATSIVFMLLIVGCSGQSTKQRIRSTPTANININDLKGTKELYVIFSKNNDGYPVSLINITSDQVAALNYFKDSSVIKTKDCIRLAENNKTTVCDEKKWFEYGLNDETRLTTRKAASRNLANPVNTVVRTALTPLAVLQDVLKADTSLSHTKNHILTTYTDPVQDFDELKIARDGVIDLAYNQYLKEKNQAMVSTEDAVNFAQKYPKDNFSSIINSNLSLAIQNKAHKDIFKVLTELPVSSEQKNNGIDALRHFGSFDGFATAFNLSRDVNDAKKANAFARSENDKQKSEYMGVQLAMKNAFNISITNTGQGNTNQTKDIPIFSFKDNVNQVTTDFSCNAKIQAVKSLGLEYGNYNVVIKATLKTPKHRMLRSNWLGNDDKDYIDEQVQKETIRIGKPKFSANISTVFKNILSNYKDKGMMGGTTEITITGDPRCSMEVVDVALVQ